MKAVFVDTGGWMACADGADPAHARCRAARDSALEGGYTLITTEDVRVVRPLRNGALSIFHLPSQGAFLTHPA